MRGLLVVNPRATTTSARAIDVIVHALSDEIDLDVTITTHRGHAIALGERARRDKLDIVITLGGDGVINEAVTGMLVDGPGPDVPALATVPGGSGNVFARALGLPVDPVEATGQIMDAVRAGRRRSIGLGLAHGVDERPRWIIANAGIGLDAEIIAEMEAQRTLGKRASPMRYLGTTLQQYFVRTNKSAPMITLERPGNAPVEGVYLAIIQNVAPWTYFGPWPIDPCPEASFDTGLDVFAMRTLRLVSSLHAARRFVTSARGRPLHRGIARWHDQSELTVRCRQPLPIQIDGEGMGVASVVRFESVPNALQTLA